MSHSESEYELTDFSTEKNGLRELCNFLRGIIGIGNITTATGSLDKQIQCYKNDILEQIRNLNQSRDALKTTIEQIKHTPDANLEEPTEALFNFNASLLEKLSRHFYSGGTPSPSLMLAFDPIAPSFGDELRKAFLSLYTSTKMLDDQFKLHDTLQQILGWISQYESVVEDVQITALKNKNIWELTQADIETATEHFNGIIERNSDMLQDLMQRMGFQSGAQPLASMVVQIRNKYIETSRALESAKQELGQLQRLQSQLETSEKKNTALKAELTDIRALLEIGDAESPAAKIKELLAAQQNLKATSEELTRLSSENDGLRDRLALLEESNAAIEPLTRELEALRDQNTLLEEEKRAHLEEKTRYLAANGQLKDGLAAREQEIERISALLKAQEAQNCELNDLNEGLQRDISTLEGRLRTFEEENARLGERCSLFEEEYLRYMDFIRAQQKTIDAQAREIEALRADLDQFGPDEEGMSRSTTSHESDSAIESAEFVGAPETELSLEIYAHETPPGHCDSLDGIQSHNLNPEAIALKKNVTRTVYSPSGQAYQFEVTDTQSIATLPKTQQSRDTFAQQKLALTTINILQNVLINHDVISLDTRNDDIVTYAAHYIHFLNEKYSTTIELKINGELVNLSAMVKKTYPIIESLEPEFLESTHWFEAFATRHHIAYSSVGLRR